MEHISSVVPLENSQKKWKSKMVGPFSRLEFPNGISCSIYTFLLVCTSSRSTARKSIGHRDVPGFTTKWNNFLPIGNSTFAPTEISGFLFLNGKRPEYPNKTKLYRNISLSMVMACHADVIEIMTLLRLAPQTV